jgi:cytochrome P450
LDEAAAQGPLTRLRIGRITVWIVTDSDIARQVLLTAGDSWVRPSNFRIPTRLALGENLFTLPDRKWKLIGPMLSPYFHGLAFSSRLSRASALIAEDVAAWPRHRLIDLDEATSRLALRTATWLLFGEEIALERANDLVRHQRALMDWLGERISRPSALLPFTIGAAGRAMKEHRDGLHTYIREMIERRQRTATNDDVLSALQAARPPPVTA